MTQVVNFQVVGVYCKPTKDPRVSIAIQTKNKSVYLPQNIIPTEEFYEAVGLARPLSEMNSSFFVGLKGKCLGSFNKNIFQFEGWKSKEEN